MGLFVGSHPHQGPGNKKQDVGLMGLVKTHRLADSYFGRSLSPQPYPNYATEELSIPWPLRDI